MQEEDLARCLRDNEEEEEDEEAVDDVGGNDDEEAEQNADEEGLLYAAEARGQEKMDQIMRALPPLQVH